VTKNLFTPEFIIPLEGRKSTLMSAGTESLHLFRGIGTSNCPHDSEAGVRILQQDELVIAELLQFLV
jgi:hypothetical protein